MPDRKEINDHVEAGTAALSAAADPLKAAELATLMDAACREQDATLSDVMMAHAVLLADMVPDGFDGACLLGAIFAVASRLHRMPEDQKVPLKRKTH